jgi:hypothetical protein
MTDEKPRQPKFRYEDTPGLSETFADSIGQWLFDGNTLRIEFLVSRLDETKPDVQPTGRRLPVCRLVLSTNGAIELLNRSQQLTAALEKAGLVKKKSEEQQAAAPN